MHPGYCNHLQILLPTKYQLAHAGAVELAGVGIALSVYGTVTKLFNVPLLSVATSSVATALGDQEGEVLPSHSMHSMLMLTMRHRLLLLAMGYLC